jgi:hypothetical protein
MITANTFVGRITGARPHVEGVESVYTCQQKAPQAVVLGFMVIDNSTGVSARERRRL